EKRKIKIVLTPSATAPHTILGAQTPFTSLAAMASAAASADSRNKPNRAGFPNGCLLNNESQKKPIKKQIAKPKMNNDLDGTLNRSNPGSRETQSIKGLLIPHAHKSAA
ncbi:MAG: hypothetical protein AAGU05_09305, partial [Anaerolineaceae bacterium]